MLAITQKGIRLGILLALIAVFSTLGIFTLYQKKQTFDNTEQQSTSTAEAEDTESTTP